MENFSGMSETMGCANTRLTVDEVTMWEARIGGDRAVADELIKYIQTHLNVAGVITHTPSGSEFDDQWLIEFLLTQEQAVIVKAHIATLDLGATCYELAGSKVCIEE